MMGNQSPFREVTTSTTSTHGTTILTPRIQKSSLHQFKIAKPSSPMGGGAISSRLASPRHAGSPFKHPGLIKKNLFSSQISPKLINSSSGINNNSTGSISSPCFNKNQLLGSVINATPTKSKSASSSLDFLLESPSLTNSNKLSNLKNKSKTYDRFIPNRANMDLNNSQFQMTQKQNDKSNMDTAELAYQEEIAKACGIVLDKRVLTFSAQPPSSEKVVLQQSWNRPLKPNHAVRKRKIKQAPEKVLDAPGMLDDYYLNLMDWSSRNLLAIALDKSIYVWNADTGSVSDFCSTAEDDYISSLQFTADGSYLAIGTSHGDTQIWDVQSHTKIRSMKGHVSRVSALSWDKHILSSGTRDGSIWNHDVRIPQHKVSEYLRHTSEVCGLKWRPDGQMLASGGNDNLVNIWDVRSTEPRFTKTEHTAAVKAIAWCPWQISLLSTGGGSYDKKIHFWNSTTGAKLSTIDTGSQVTSIIWSKQYKELISSHGFPDNHLSVWSYPSLNKVIDLPGHDARVLHTALSPDGQTVASSASDENLKFWKVFEAKARTKSSSSDSTEDLVNATRRLAIR